MDPLIRLGVAIFLLLMTLSFALSFLAGPLALLKRFGVLKAVRWTIRSVGGAVAGLVRLVLRGRRRRIRRTHLGARMGSSR